VTTTAAIVARRPDTARTVVGDQTVFTYRFLGTPRRYGACYATITTHPCITTPPVITHSRGKAAALAAHADAVRVLVCDLDASE
jgi:hypothetical protein